MTLQTGNSFDYLYHKGYCKLTGIELSRQTNKKIPQQINFVGKLEKDNGVGKLEKDNGATVLSVSKKQEKTILNLSLDSLTVTNNIDNGTSKIIKFSK